MEDLPNLGEQRERMSNAMISAMDDIDREHLRKMQRDMHGCAKRCCADMDANADAVQRCVDRCQLPLSRARCYVQQELAVFESRMEHCLRNCQLPGEDSLGSYTERCSMDCVDKFVALLPEVLSAMRAVLEKGL